MNRPTPETDKFFATFADAIRERDEWKAKYIQQNKDLGCEMMDPNGTIWDYAKKVQTELAEVTEQRDRLAEALEHTMKHMRHSLNCPARLTEGLHACNCQMEWAYDNATEALQSLTTNASRLASADPESPNP